MQPFNINNTFPSSLNPWALLKTVDHHTLSAENKIFLVMSVIQVWGKTLKDGTWVTILNWLWLMWCSLGNMSYRKRKRAKEKEKNWHSVTTRCCLVVFSFSNWIKYNAKIVKLIWYLSLLIHAILVYQFPSHPSCNSENKILIIACFENCRLLKWKAKTNCLHLMVEARIANTPIYTSVH